MTLGFELKPRVIAAGTRMITKEGRRFKIYLPMALNDLWQKFNEKKIRFQVYLVPIDEE